jgi:hypothetical protein
MNDREKIRVSKLMIEIDCNSEPIKNDFDQEMKAVFKRFSDEISEAALFERPRKIRITDSKGVKVGIIRVVQTPSPLTL